MTSTQLTQSRDFPQLAHSTSLVQQTNPHPSSPDEQAAAEDMRRLNDLPVRVTAIVGRAHIEIGALLAMKPGEVLALDRKVGEAIDILVNDRLVARGQVVMVGDRLGITMAEIFKTES